MRMATSLALPASLTNATFGPYVLRNHVSAGGIAEVYRGQHRDDQSEVAIKVMRPERAGDKLHSKAFADEYALLARLRHPAIPRGLRDGEIKGRPCFAMELIPGEPLHQVVMNELKFDPISAFSRLVKAVAYLHENDIVHNDLKLENVLLRPHNYIGLVDFGNSRDLTQKAGLMARLFGKRKASLFGTPTYTAPELLDGSGEPTFASDIYSLGVCAFMLLCGEPPFNQERKSARMRATVNLDAPSIRSRVPRLALPMAKVIDACLAKDPQGRHADASRLRAALAAVGATSAAHPQVHIA
ncbi:MAG: serine/threonine protein kinase [Planctomycetes bacterium]|nr:serine/threonine protein kinase [Planctomycetota bacterium]